MACNLRFKPKDGKSTYPIPISNVVDHTVVELDHTVAVEFRKSHSQTKAITRFMPTRPEELKHKSYEFEVNVRFGMNAQIVNIRLVCNGYKCNASAPLQPSSQLNALVFSNENAHADKELFRDLNIYIHMLPPVPRLDVTCETLQF
uniref:Uncharacterized protein n=1 Tax=Glossina pallidipes TaxID=7398 RepID=A0A1A9ZVF3_GLOPL